MSKLKPPPSLDPKDAESIIAEIEAMAAIMSVTYDEMPPRAKSMMLHFSGSMFRLKKTLMKYE